MITKQDLLEAIAECQGTRSPNANTAIKLAAFYTILDHLDDGGGKESIMPAQEPSLSGYSFAGESVVKIDSDSDFAKVIDGLPQSDVWPVLDELMSTIRIMNERLYNGVMKKLTN